MSDEFRNDADADEGDYADSWSAKPGDILCGEVLGYRMNVGQYHTTVATIADEDTGEERALWISTAAMVDWFDEMKPRVGERVYVRRLPDGQSKTSGQSYKKWILKVDREGGGTPVEPSFSGYEPDDAPRGTEAADQQASVPEAAPAPEDPDDDLPF